MLADLALGKESEFLSLMRQAPKARPHYLGPLLGIGASARIQFSQWLNRREV